MQDWEGQIAQCLFRNCGKAFDRADNALFEIVLSSKGIQSCQVITRSANLVNGLISLECH
jgi:hypothetical protein